MSLSSHVQEVKTSLVSAGLATGSVALLPADLDLTTNLSVTFGDKSVGLGNLLRSSDCKTAPKISFSAEAGHESHAYTYTLFLVDPDAPTPDDPKFAYWRHWVVSGLEPSSTHTSSSSSSSQSALTEYLGPGPKDDSRPHRYLFLLYREPAGFSLSKSDVGGEEFTDRRSFQAHDFVRKHGLKLVAINWMLGAGDGWKA